MAAESTVVINSFVEIPSLTPIAKPVRKSGETKELFLKRVRTLHAERSEEIYPLQKAFRLAVEVDTLQDVNHDLDEMLNLEQKKYVDNKAWLFIIAIEEYKYADSVLFANRTGKMVKATFQKKLDINDRNIITLYDEEATVENIRDQLRQLMRRVQRNDVIYFYYCGHGLSNESGEQLILPYDGMADFMDPKNTIKIERLYNKFLNSKALRTFSFVDASFDGTTDGVAVIKGVVNPEKSPRSVGYHKRLNILNSSRAQDTANAYFDKEYRLFSYFLVKEALSKPQNAGELFDNVRTYIR
jgi:hypothetical protein